ncbi:hypothetical protein ACFE6N_22945 [Pedobacter sp. BG31]|uniref:hypothetical protein n=1 Tax=Pedobacter sp. BG31 TaxID=3349697 RepID=UPI0035F39B2A
MILRNLCFLMIVFSSCTINKSIIGNYSKIAKGYSSTLKLNKDSTFVFTEQYLEVNSKCQGKWFFIPPKEILLKCSAENFPAEISGGDISEREKKVTILSPRKVQIGKIILLKDKN